MEKLLKFIFSRNKRTFLVLLGASLILILVFHSQTEESDYFAHLPNFGKELSSEEIAKWDLTVTPDGENLPEGYGTFAEGKIIYNRQCKECHGKDGRGLSAEELVGYVGSLKTVEKVKTIGSYWPYATTLFDYIRRAMPPASPYSLSVNQTYSIVAYLLSLNGIFPVDGQLNRDTLIKIEMPNRYGFVNVDAK